MTENQNAAENSGGPPLAVSVELHSTGVEESKRKDSEVVVPVYPDPYQGRNALELLPLADVIVQAPKLLKWYLGKSIHHYRYNHASLKKEVLSGLTVSVLQVPESVAFSYVAGVDPVSGLHATFFLGFLTAALGGKPGMISGAAGALAVVMKDIMAVNGPLADLTQAQRFEHLLMVVVFIGVFQIVAGFMQLAKFVRLIPQSAMVGFMNGLAIIIFMAQFSAFEKCSKYAKYQMCTESEREWITLDTGNTWMLLVLVFGTMAVMHFFPRIPRIGKALPASMVALVVATAFEHGINRAAIGYDTRTVADTAPINGGFPKAHFPDVSGTSHWSTIFSYAGSLAAIGLIESVMTLQAVDEITETPPSTLRNNQECVAQGVANFFCGFFGAMGGDAMIGQSTINVMNGARGRLSGMIAGLAMLFIVVVASPVIELVPIGALTGVLFMVVLHTFNWSTFKLLHKVRRSDAFVIVMVTALAVLTNLAIAVFAGVAFTALVNSWDAGKVFKAVTRLHREKYTHRVLYKTYHIYGSLFFGSARAFSELFDPLNDPERVVINFEHSLICDFSALAAIYSLQKRYASHDKVINIEGLCTKSKNQMRKQQHVANAVDFNLNTPSFVAIHPPTPGHVSPVKMRSPHATHSMPDLVLSRFSGDDPRASSRSNNADVESAIQMVSREPSPRRLNTIENLQLFNVLPSGPDDDMNLQAAIDMVEHDQKLHTNHDVHADEEILESNLSASEESPNDIEHHSNFGLRERTRASDRKGGSHRNVGNTEEDQEDQEDQEAVRVIDFAFKLSRGDGSDDDAKE